MNIVQSILLSLLCGILPSILWLIFWLREDKEKPEPRKRILEAFLGGMACILLVLPLESLVFHTAGSPSPTPFYVVFLWAAIEESLKFAACYFLVLRTRDDDEPIDSVIYMIITALGFSALENSLFLFHPLFYDNNLLGGLVTENLRFIGASLLHILSSSIVGIFIAFSFYKPKVHKKVNVLIGLFFAILVHSFFNAVVADKTTGGPIILTFSAVWWGIIALIIIFEKIKLIHPDDLPPALLHVDPKAEGQFEMDKVVIQ